ncbi:MAG: hypothetical protein AB7V14_09485 [Kiritimatiellia bacterium]
MAGVGRWWKAIGTWMAAAALVAGCETSSLEDEGTISLAELQGETVAANTETAAAEATPTTTETTTSVATETTTSTTTADAAASGSTSATTAGVSTAGAWPAEITGSIQWLHTDVSAWPVTASLSASVGSSTINMPYDKAKVWPAVDGVNANPWVIVKWTDGQWYAATFEWFRYGQTSKPKGVLDGSKGDHIKKPPLSSWRPSSGERFGIMVSGLARTETRNVKERSNVSMVTWP